ncbi:MAG: hypothetical protein K8R77_03360 [Anaerolineaceae bacterium]|nr:hypothetical protein [Anaerolineaceae bacterium]
MRFIKRDGLEQIILPGRLIQKAVGKDCPVDSSKMTVGFAHYSAESGAMEPHHHAEEVCYILFAYKGWVRYGPSPDRLGEPVALETGMLLHNPPLEWHVFEYGEGGHVDIIFVYGQVDNIRPEES